MRKIIELGQQGNRSEAMRRFNKLSPYMKKRFKEYAFKNYNASTYKDIVFYFNL